MNNQVEFLTKIYLDHQDFTALTPEKLVELYLETINRIEKALQASSNSNNDNHKQKIYY